MNRLLATTLRPPRRAPIETLPEPESSSEETITVESIIKDKPPIKDVRFYFKEMTKGIQDD